MSVQLSYTQCISFRLYIHIRKSGSVAWAADRLSSDDQRCSSRFMRVLFLCDILRFHWKRSRPRPSQAAGRYTPLYKVLLYSLGACVIWCQVLNKITAHTRERQRVEISKWEADVLTGKLGQVHWHGRQLYDGEMGKDDMWWSKTVELTLTDLLIQPVLCLRVFCRMQSYLARPFYVETGLRGRSADVYAGLCGTAGTT